MENKACSVCPNSRENRKLPALKRVVRKTNSLVQHQCWDWQPDLAPENCWYLKSKAGCGVHRLFSGALDESLITGQLLRGKSGCCFVIRAATDAL
jgi:hypothetical protein